MTNEERSLKLMKIKKYRASLSETENDINRYSITLALYATCIVGSILFNESEEVSNYIGDNLKYFGTGMTAVTIGQLKSMIQAICKKANLESTIDDLELDLQLDQSSQGGKRL